MLSVTKSIFCRQNWVFPFVLPLETFQIEIRHQSKNSNPDHLQLLKVRIRIRLQVIQDVLRLLKILFCHQYMNSKYTAGPHPNHFLDLFEAMFSGYCPSPPPTRSNVKDRRTWLDCPKLPFCSKR